MNGSANIANGSTFPRAFGETSTEPNLFPSGQLASLLRTVELTTAVAGTQFVRRDEESTPVAAVSASGSGSGSGSHAQSPARHQRSPSGTAPLSAAIATVASTFSPSSSTSSMTISSTSPTNANAPAQGTVAALSAAVSGTTVVSSKPMCAAFAASGRCFMGNACRFSHERQLQGKGASFASASPARVQIDSSKDTCEIQLLLGGRQPLTVTFNRAHTVLDIYQHAQFVLKQVGPFELRCGDPPKLLSDPFATIEDAKLAGATIVCQSNLI